RVLAAAVAGPVAVALIGAHHPDPGPAQDRGDGVGLGSGVEVDLLWCDEHGQWSAGLSDPEPISGQAYGVLGAGRFHTRPYAYGRVHARRVGPETVRLGAGQPVRVMAQPGGWWAWVQPWVRPHRPHPPHRPQSRRGHARRA
ncbi:MAG: hypothetical protein ACRD0H_01970, partial [Actinomycetes bacterium]